MKLKNYIVKMRNVNFDGIKRYIDYLHNENHKNHIDKSLIINLNNISAENSIRNIIDLKNENEKNYVLNGKGGKKLKRAFKSLTFNIPKSFKYSQEDFQKIGNDLQSKIIEYIENKENIKMDKNSFVNIGHLQENGHFHLLIPTLDENGNNVRYLNHKHFLNVTKVLFIDIVDKQLKTNIKDYEINQHTEENQKEDYIQNKENELYILYKELFGKLRIELEEKELLSTLEKNQQFYKSTSKILNRLEKKIEDENYEDDIQIQKTEKNLFNRLEKIEKIEKLNINYYDEVQKLHTKRNKAKKSKIQGNVSGIE